VENVLNLNSKEAHRLSESLTINFPIVLTRDLSTAKQWLRSKMRGNRRIGMIASSGAKRAQADGLNLLNIGEEPNWFLNDKSDIRSSYYLELAATEFGIQGLEIDWAGLCWEADLRFAYNTWLFNKFTGTSWNLIHKEATRTYLINKYRVLLTRAREGMIIYIPLGDLNDHTRLPDFYNGTADYLKNCGISEV
jgi:hypothetical protein